MTSGADERSRTLGGGVCLAAVAAGALFLYGLAVKSYWALALPLAAAALFILVLVFWIGWTIATVQVDGEGESLSPVSGGPGAATTPDPAAETDIPDAGPSPR